MFNRLTEPPLPPLLGAAEVATGAADETGLEPEPPPVEPPPDDVPSETVTVALPEEK